VQGLILNAVLATLDDTRISDGGEFLLLLMAAAADVLACDAYHVKSAEQLKMLHLHGEHEQEADEHDNDDEDVLPPSSTIEPALEYLPLEPPHYVIEQEQPK
jgi:hypothetical protein